MRSRAMFFAAAVALASSPVAAQTVTDPTEPGAPAEPGASLEPGASGGTSTTPAAPTGWVLHPGERHITVRAEATLGARLNDPFAAGTLAPITPYLQGSFLFLNVGRFQMGPALGFGLGLDPVGLQYSVQPGWHVLRRFSGRVGVTARLEVPILITRGACPTERVPLDPRGGSFPGMGFQINRTSIPVPGTGFCPTTAVGVEAAVGGAFYITSGIAITAEAIFNMYFGDSGITFPILGGGLGLMVDYEVLP